LRVVCDVTQRPEVQSELLSHGSPGLPSTQSELGGVLDAFDAQWVETQSLSLEHGEPVMRSVH
jgi:hypothetical protein